MMQEENMTANVWVKRSMMVERFPQRHQLCRYDVTLCCYDGFHGIIKG